MARSLLLAGAVTGLLCATSPAYGNGASQSLRDRASVELYNLDRDASLETFRAAIAADPGDAGAYRGLASVLWLTITFRRGNMTVDDYLGGVTRRSVKMTPPAPDVAAAFADAIDHALTISRGRLQANPKDVDARYETGSAVGLRASYIATVDGSMMGAFRAAREAYNAHEDVLDADPGRKDAGLIVGTYRYLVAALAMPLRLFAYASGFGGGKEKGLQMIEAAAAYPGDNQADARVALVLLYNRERRYDDALKQLSELRARYPRNRLFLLEAGATCLRAGRPADAERFLNEGVARFAGDNRQRMFGEVGLWYYKRGAARAALGRASEARADLTTSLASESRNWVRGRAHIELGKLALKVGDRDAARAELQKAIPLCDADNDALSADEARRLLDNAG